MKLSFIGLGVMGYPMAGFLQKAGHDVTVYNRTTAKADKWAAEYNGASAPTPALAAKDADIVFTCVGNDDDLRQVTKGEHGAFHGMKAGAILVDHTTASAEVAKELSAVAQQSELKFADAPVSGGQAGAENGSLTIMVGASEEDYAVIEPVMAVYFQQCLLMGPVGSGQLTKMCNQVAIAGAVQGVSESLHLARQAGLDVKKAIKVMQKGSAASWFMENRANTMDNNQFDFGFAVDWMYKDLGIALDQAAKSGATLDIAQTINTYFKELQENGHGRHDVSCLITRLNS